jgi:ATP-dependent RNA helicase DDX5/DBP2
MIDQIVEVVTDWDKYTRLMHYLKDYNDGSRVIIFVETKKGCDQLTKSLRMSDYPARAIHGDKTQQERDQVLAEFRSGRTPILVATDVAARGLDIKDVRIVVNFDMPGTAEDYVHRIGRTGRAGAKGVALSFFTDKHARLASEIVNLLREANQEIPPQLLAMGGRGGGGGGAGARGRWGGGGGGYGGRR